MLRLSYPSETVLCSKFSRNRIVLSFRESPRKTLGQRPEGQTYVGANVYRSSASQCGAFVPTLKSSSGHCCLCLEEHLCNKTVH